MTVRPGVYLHEWLAKLRARYYDPYTAQFLSRDPPEAQTRAPYNCTGDNPLNRTDASGLGWCQDQLHADGQTCSLVAGSSYTGPTKTCIVMGGGQNTTDSVEVEGSTPCSALGANGYTVVDPTDEGKTPPDETCSSDPGSGFSHCETHRSAL
jgi:hypothetical protein